MTDEQVCIPAKELERLREADRFLERLYAAGVANWEGFEFALEDEDDED